MGTVQLSIHLVLAGSSVVVSVEYTLSFQSMVLPTNSQSGEPKPTFHHDCIPNLFLDVLKPQTKTRSDYDSMAVLLSLSLALSYPLCYYDCHCNIFITVLLSLGRHMVA